MINKIKILDPQESIKIAAGEVIERPAHIVKELIENSLDAQAKNISIYIEKAGKTLIKIIDDGVGMSPDDAKLCFAHHATSKINSIHDLENITTFGFRGEALSSIASVSHITLITKTEHEKLATKVNLNFGTIQSIDVCNHPIGTTLTITHLFENIPARKKFLKTDETERNCIINIFQAFALERIDVTFKLFDHDVLLFNCPTTTNLALRCAQLWDNHLFQHLIPLQPLQQNDLHITGTISTPAYERFGRNQIFTFVNNRWVKNTEISKGIMKGYDGVLAYQKFPAAFIFITVPTNQIDVNVHPKKEEVKFLHQLQVQNLVTKAIEQTLTHFTTYNITEKPKNIPLSLNKIFIPSTTAPIEHVTTIQPKTAVTETIAIFNSPVPTVPIQKPTINTVIFEDIPDYSIIGQIKKTYIIVEKEDQIIVIDQHAAHERIVYQRLKNTTHASESIPLLFPHIIKLNAQEIALLQQHQEIFHHHGIIIDQLNDHELIIQATPIESNGQKTQLIIEQVLLWLHEHENIEKVTLIEQLHDQIIMQKACKTAIKAGDILDIQQMKNLIEQLRATEHNFSCPHGRPTLWNLTFETIEKHFKRDYIQSKPILF